MVATLLQNFDPTTGMTFGADFEMRDGDQFGSVRLSMPVLHFPEPLTSKYGVNPNFEDNGRYPLELSVTPEIEDKITKIEDHIQRSFDENARTWFKKDKKSSYTFSRLLRETDDGIVLKIKVNNNTMMRILSEDGTTILKTETATIAHVNRHCKILPFLQSYSLWVNTKDHTYGVSLTAMILLVQPGLKEDVLESMILSAGYAYE